MLTISIRKKFSKQLKYFQSQIPLGIQASRIPVSTVNHYHEIISEIERESEEDLSKFRIPSEVRWNEDVYITDGVRDRLGSLIGYLDSEVIEEKESGSVEIITVISSIRRTLRKIIKTKPDSEKQVQSSVEDLLNVLQVNFSREGGHFQYSSKTYVPDFLLIDLDCVLEIKFCNRPEREKELIGEINDDIKAYKTRYKSIIFLVYAIDGHIRDEEKFKNDIESDSVIVEIVRY